MEGKGNSTCTCHLAPLSATIHTVRAIHSQHHTLPILCSHFLTHKRQMVFCFFRSRVQPHRYHAVHIAHVCPTRHVTGDVMLLAEAITLLLQHCASRLLRPSLSAAAVRVLLQCVCVAAVCVCCCCVCVAAVCVLLLCVCCCCVCVAVVCVLLLCVCVAVVCVLLCVCCCVCLCLCVF